MKIGVLKIFLEQAQALFRRDIKYTVKEVHRKAASDETTLA